MGYISISHCFYLFTMLLAICSCGQNSNEHFSEYTYSHEDISVIDLEQYPDLIDYIKPTYEASQFIDISNIWRFFIRDKRIIMIQHGEQIEVSTFSLEGEQLMHQIIPESGPDALKSLTDAWMNNNRIELLDYGTSSVYGLNLNGGSLKFLYSIPVGFNEGSPLGNEKFILHADNSPNDLGNYNLNLINLSDNQIIDQDDEIYKFHSGIGLERRPFFNMQQALYYYPPIGTSIFHISDNDISEVLSIKSGKDILKNLNNISQGDFLDIRRKQEFVTCFDYVFGFNNVLFGQFRFNRMFFWVIMDLDNDQLKVVRPEIPFVDEMKLTYQPRGIDEDGNLYFIAYSYDIKNYINTSDNDAFILNIKSKISEFGSDEDPIFLSINLLELKGIIMN